MKLLTFLEATNRLSMNDAIDIVREIETGRGGIAKLMEKKPYFKEMSQAKLRSEHGDVVPLFRVLSIPEGKERRPDGIVSTTTDWKVAYAMGRDLPGVMMGKNGFISMQKVLLRYDVPVEQCLADVNMLLEMVVDALGGFEKIGNQQLRGRSGPVAVSLLIKEGMKEDEVIADVTGLESVVLEFGSHVSGRQEMEMIRGLDAGDYDSPEEYMAHRIANKGSNEFFSPEEMEELKAMYGNKAPDVKRFLGREGMNEADDRLARARSMGFDTDLVVYRGRTVPIGSDNPSGVVWTTTSPGYAGFYTTGQGKTPQDWQDSDVLSSNMSPEEKKALDDRMLEVSSQLEVAYAELDAYRETMHDAIKPYSNQSSEAYRERINGLKKLGAQFTDEMLSMIDGYFDIANRYEKAYQEYEKIRYELMSARDQGGYIEPSYVRIKKPFFAEDEGQVFTEDEEYFQMLRSRGYDAIIWSPIHEYGDLNASNWRDAVKQGAKYSYGPEIVILDPKNIRSVNAKFEDGESDDLMASVGMNEELYHATTHDIDKFNPLSHFGTPKAAAKRADAISDWPQPEAPRTYRANMELKNPVMMVDDGGHHDYAIQIAKGIDQYYRNGERGTPEFSMLYDLRHMMDRWKQAGMREHDAEQRKELIEFLKSHGYDGIAYANDVEDDGRLSYMNLDPVVAESAQAGVTINYNGQPKVGVMPQRSMNDSTVMMLPTAVMDAAFKRGGSDFYVGPNGSGAAIGKRYAGFQDWISKHDTYELPEVGVRDNGIMGFTNGRHRYAVLRDAGVDPMPVAMGNYDIENAKKLGGVIREDVDGDKVWYHGTVSAFDKFEPNSSGLYFTDDPDEASQYAADWEQEGDNIIPVHLTMKNPYVMDYSEMHMDDINPEYYARQGYDSVLYGDGHAAVVFDPSQVKSIFGEADYTEPDQTFYHVSNDALPIGTILKPQGKTWTDADRVLERFRPKGMLSRQQAVFMFPSFDDAEGVGLVGIHGVVEGYLCEVEPVGGPAGRSWHHVWWYEQIVRELRDAQSSMEMDEQEFAEFQQFLEALAMKYWNGDDGPEPGWEILAPAAKIVKYLGPAEDVLYESGVAESITEMADPSLIKAAAPKALAMLKKEIASGIDDAHEDFETETGVEDGDPKWKEKFAIWKEGYAQRRIGRAIGEITKGAEYIDGKMVVHRMMRVDMDAFLVGLQSGASLGTYWTWDKNYADTYAAQGGDSEIIMTGLVDPVAIDWAQTILMNAHPAAEEELEINIPEGTPIKLMNVDADGRVVDPSMYPQGRVLTASLGESQLDDDYARGYNEGQLEGIKAGHEWYKNNMGKADKEPPEFDNFHVRRGRVTKANGYAKAYAYGYQDGYYTMQTGGDAEHLIAKIQAKLSEGVSVQMSSDEMIQYLRQHHDANLHQDYIDHIHSFDSFVLRDIPIASIAKTELAGLEQAKVAQYKGMDFSNSPPIVMGGGHILDGYHRVSVAKALGIQSIKGYVGLES